MNNFIFVLGAALLVTLLLGWYSYTSFVGTFNITSTWALWSTRIVVTLPALVLIVAMVSILVTPEQNKAFQVLTRLLGLLILFLVPQLGFLLFMFVQDLIRLVVWGVSKLSAESGSTDFMPSRRKFIGQAAAGVAAIQFGSILFGIVKGKYNFKARQVKLRFPNLPKAFNGYKIVQISDIHSGSFDDPEGVQRGIDMINEQEADAVFFTGDLVNNLAEEIDPWIPQFKQIKAKDGVFSILGNHDYGEYVEWPSAQAKEDNILRLHGKHKDLNFDLLLNENRTIKRGNESIALVGVENWGEKPFPQLGDLNKAVSGVEQEAFKILLSHDPSHWDHQVLDHQQRFDLTLSGHTHGMQFGIEIPGFKWSPVKFKYPRWAGLYQEKDQYLYVNRGFGFIGFRGRVGIWPEITVIELESDQA